MPNFSFRVAVPAGGIVANALAGSPFEFVGRDSKVAVALAMEPDAAPPLNGGTVTATVSFGSELQLQGGVVPMSNPVQVGVDPGAQIPQNVIVDDVAAAGDRLVIELVSTDATPNNVSGIVRILPL
ncbi:MAG: hypothetical protein ACYTAF_10575 [Planctomycetota bacterium]|jgi:hypothetical protein